MKKSAFLFWGLLLAFYSLNSQTYQALDYDYTRIDRHAQAAPVTLEQDLDRLTAYLIRPAKNDVEKVRAVSAWISLHITYDYEVLNSKDYSGYSGIETTAQTVLSRKKGVCAGYSALFVAMMRRAEVPAEEVVGYAKGVGYVIGQDFERTNHAWNKVYLQGQWRLLDLCWASIKKGEKTLDEDYYLSDPKFFILEHLPENPEDQFLVKPWGMERFTNIPRLETRFLRFGFKGFSPSSGIVKAVRGKAKLALRASQYGSFHIRVTEVESQQPVEDFSYEVIKKDEGVQFLLSFPSRGKYLVKILSEAPANSVDPKGWQYEIMTYVIESEGSPNF